jgi:hypothetical protein
MAHVPASDPVGELAADITLLFGSCQPAVMNAAARNCRCMKRRHRVSFLIGGLSRLDAAVTARTIQVTNRCGCTNAPGDLYANICHRTERLQL